MIVIIDDNSAIAPYDTAIGANSLEQKERYDIIVIEYRVRDLCWHACSVVGEGKYKKADSKTLY